MIGRGRKGTTNWNFNGDDDNDVLQAHCICELQMQHLRIVYRSVRIVQFPPSILPYVSLCLSIRVCRSIIFWRQMAQLFNVLRVARLLIALPAGSWIPSSLCMDCLHLRRLHVFLMRNLDRLERGMALFPLVRIVCANRWAPPRLRILGTCLRRKVNLSFLTSYVKALCSETDITIIRLMMRLRGDVRASFEKY